MYCIGLTGNIASGKSTVITCFESLGIEIISADKIARQLTEPKTPAFDTISNYFGSSSLHSDGSLNRNFLRSVIFKNKEKRIWLENLLHPLIREKIYLQAINTVSAYCVLEIPLLLNRNDYPYINRILVVLSDVKVQLNRVMQRDNCHLAQAQAILATQPNELERRKIADDLITNNTTLDVLKKQVAELHQVYLKKAKEYAKVTNK